MNRCNRAGAGFLRLACAWLALAFVLVVAVGRGDAAERTLSVGGVSVSLEDVTGEVDVQFQSMRLNRALNVWNVEATLTNKGGRAISGPLILFVDSFSGTTGPLLPDGSDSPAQPFFDLTGLAPEGVLEPGGKTRAKTLSLGVSAGAPRLVSRVLAGKNKPPVARALARTLNAAGQPLAEVIANEAGPNGTATRSTDPVFALATLGQGSGVHTWKFSKANYLPVWRTENLSTGAVRVLPSPRLTPRDTNSVTATPIGGAQLSAANRSIQVSLVPGALNQNASVSLTPLNGQSLPLSLPLGWSPLQAFWFESSVEPAALTDAMLVPWGSLANGENAVLVRLNSSTVQWEVVQIIPGSGTNGLAAKLPGSGAYALVVPDAPPTAPPPAVTGQAILPGTTNVPAVQTLSASGTVTPSSSPASRTPELVTATAAVTISHGSAALPSGMILRGEVTENYRLQDGTTRHPPQYENFIVAYQRPGDADALTLQAAFPLRPLLLFGAEELVEGTVKVEIVAPGAFTGGLVDADGGLVANEDLRVLAGSGAVVEPQAVQLRRLNPTNFTDLVGGGGGVLAAFDLGIGTAAQHLVAQTGLMPSNGVFVLARVLYDQGLYGLQPVERLVSDGAGRLSSAEPGTGERLGGLSGAGQYVMVQLSGPQGVVSGTARNSAGQASAGLPVRIEGQPWLTFSGSNGAYQLLAPTGSVVVALTDLGTGDQGSASVSLNDPANPVLANVQTASSGPRVTSVSPGNGSIRVARVSPVTIVFSEAVNPATLLGGGIRVVGTNGQVVAASLTLNLRNTSATLLPTEQLAPETLFTIQISTNITDLAGLRLEGQNQFTFSTESDRLNRGAAQITSYEPTNGLARMVGSAGIAEPEAPVILVNETSGKTATVLSRPDGSFDNFIEAEVDDFLSAIIVNANGSRNVIPVNRQLFADGSVGLFQSGGRIEAQAEDGPVAVVVDPGAIAGKTKFRLDPTTRSNALEEAEGALPGESALVGGFHLEISGDPLQHPAHLEFPFDATKLQLPPGFEPTNGSFGLYEMTKVDGVPVHRIVDTMGLEGGKLVTHSPPYDGLSSSDSLLKTSFASYSILLLFRTTVTVVGRVVQIPSTNNIPITDENILDFPGVAGAVVSTAGVVTGPGLQPGGIISRGNSIGFFALNIPVTFTTTGGFLPVALKAQSFRFPGKLAFKTFIPDTGSLANIANLVFIYTSSGASDTLAPLISLVDPQPVLPINTNVTVKFNVFDNQSAPFIELVDLITNAPAGEPVSLTLPDGGPISPADVTLTQGGITSLNPTSVQQETTFKVRKSAVLIVKLRARDQAGNSREMKFSLRFGIPPTPPTDPLLPHDPTETEPPNVVSMNPNSDALVSEGDTVTIRFSEAVKQNIQSGSGISVSGSTSGTIPFSVDLSSDHMTATLHLRAVAAGETVTVQLGGSIVDLANNMLTPFTGTFRVAPAASFQLSGVNQAGGVIAHNGFAYILDQRDPGGAGALRVHRMGAPSLTANTPVGSMGLPPFPRAAVVVPGYSFKRKPGAAVETKPLLIVAGGLLGEGNVGQWIWVVDISDPLHPQRLGAELSTVDFESAITSLRYERGRFYFVVNNPEGAVFHRVNLQAFILGNSGVFATPTNPANPGADLDGNGDFVGVGETLPVPERLGLWGLEQILQVADRRFVYDFDLLLGGSFWVTTFGAVGSDKPSRLQVLSYAGEMIGLGDDLQGAIEFPGQTAARVLLEENFKLINPNGSITVPLVAIVAVGPVLKVFDITTNPKVPALIQTIPFPPGTGNILSLMRQGEDELGVGTPGTTFILRRALLGVVQTVSGTAHPSIVQKVAGSPIGRSFGFTASAIMNLGGSGLTVFSRPPVITALLFTNRPPVDIRQLVSTQDTNALAALLSPTNRIEQTFLRPATLASFGTNFPSALSDPPNPIFHYHFLLEADGEMGDKIQLAIESLDATGKRLNPKGPLFAPVMLTDFASAYGINNAQITATSVTAYRASSNPLHPLYNVYISTPVLLVREMVSPEILSKIQSFPGRQAILNGEQLRVSVESFPNTSRFPDLQNSPGANGTIGLSRTLLSLCADFVDSANPGQRQSSASIDGVNPQSGEFRLPAVDLLVEGRRQNLVLARIYESQTHYGGPFGRGWDFNYNMRLCELPEGVLPDNFVMPLVIFGNPTLDHVARPGDVLLRNGSGDLKVYRRIGPANGNEAKLPLFSSDPAINEFNWTGKISAFYEPPSGDFDLLMRFSDGAFVLVDVTGNRTFFGADGRLEQMVSAYAESKLVFHYRSDGKLDRVSGDRNVDFEFGYYGKVGEPGFGLLDKPFPSEAHLGLIARVKAGPQNIEYFYDNKGNLERVKGLGVEDTIYGYDPAPPHQLTTVGRGSGADQPAQQIFYQDGLVDHVVAEGIETRFSGTVATAEERLDAGDSQVLAVRAGQSSNINVDGQGRTLKIGGNTITVDAFGRVRFFGKTGDLTEFIYDDLNTVFRFRANLTEVKKGSYSAKSHFDGTAWNRVDTKTMPDGVTTDIAYGGDKPGTIISQTTDQNVRTSHFDVWGQLLSEEHSEGGKTFRRTVLFDFAESLPNGIKLGNLPGWTFARNGGGLGNFSLGGASLVPSFGSDGEFKGASVGGLNSQFGYDNNSGKLNSQSLSAGSGSYSESFTYDPSQPNRVQIVNATDDGGVPAQTTQLQYDSQQRVERMTRNGAVTRYGYTGATLTEITGPGLHRKMTIDPAGHVSEIEEQGIKSTHTHDSEGRLETITSQGGQWTLAYEVADRLHSQTVVDTATSQTLLDETYSYDSVGRLKTVRSDGVVWTYSYFPDNTVRSTQINGQDVNSYDKDDSGLLTSASFLGGAMSVTYANFQPMSGQPQIETTRFLDGTTLVEQYGYDSLGRYRSTTLPGGIISGMDYDDFGRVKTMTDPDGVITRYTWSAGGQPLTKTFGDGTSISYQYNGDLTLHTEGDIIYDYDSDQLPSKATFPDGKTARYEQRNSFFEPDLVTLGGISQIHSWDQGRLGSVTVNSTGDLLTFTYDGLGRETRIERNGYPLSMTYSAQHGVISETSPLGTWSATLDALGHEISETYPSGWINSFSPTAAGVPSQITEAGINSVSWVDLNLLKSVVFTNGITIRHEYDPALRVQRILYGLGTNASVGFEYGLSPGGRVLFERRIHENASDVFQRNAASEGMRVTGVLFSAGATNASSSGVSVTGMQFDPTSSELDFSAAAATGLGPRVIIPASGDSLSYNAQGAAETGPIWVNLNGVPGRFDARFFYDGFNYLHRVERVDPISGNVSVTVTYDHDGRGRVIKKTVVGPANVCRPGEWRYAWADDRLLEEYEVVAGTPRLVRRYIYLGDDFVQLQAAGTPGGPMTGFVPLVNYNGSVCGYLGPDGTIAEFIRYGAYGLPEYIGLISGVRSSRSAIGGTLLFQGCFFDEETGLSHFGARVLHPVFGSFLQRDPKLYRDSKALYLALNGDPASNRDPTGAAAGKGSDEKAPGAWKVALDMVCKGGLAKSKPTLFEVKSEGIKYFITKNSKGFSFASKLTGQLAGIVPSEKAQRFLEFSSAALELLKHSTCLIEEIQDWKKSRADFISAKWAMLRAKVQLGRATDAIYKPGLGGGRLSKRLENYDARRQAYLKTEKGYLFAKYDRINNIVNIGKAGLGLIEFVVEDVLHLDRQDQNLKYIGALEVAKSAIGFIKLRNSVKISETLADIGMRAAKTVESAEAVTTRLSVGGGFLDLPAARLATKAFCVYEAFDAGFSGGKGLATLYLGIVAPDVAREYRNKVSQFSHNGGFGFELLGGIAEAVGASNEFVSKLQNLADTEFLPSIPDIQARLEANPPFELYYRGLSAP